MQISVIICTFNRREQLRDVLNSLLNQEFNSSLNYEIIVVDNNSNDGTKDLTEEYSEKFNGRLRYVFECKQGLSYARNTGIQESKGEIVAFTDDDAILSTSWLDSINSAFLKYHCDALGGRILAKWLSTPPSWLTERFHRNLALLNYGDVPFQTNSREFPFFGCNFAIKKEVLNELSDFNTKLGRIGRFLLSGEEVDLFNRLLAANKKIFYEPDCLVYHKISKEKIQKHYFRRLYFCLGRSDFVIKTDILTGGGKSLFGIPGWLIKEFFINILDYPKELIINRSINKIFNKELNLFYKSGLIYEAYNTRYGN